jgi:heme exporter protein CcmD
MNWAEFFYMDGRAFYVWGSFGAFILAIALEIIFLRLRGKRINAEIEEEMMANKASGVTR